MGFLCIGYGQHGAAELCISLCILEEENKTTKEQGEMAMSAKMTCNFALNFQALHNFGVGNFYLWSNTKKKSGMAAREII